MASTLARPARGFLLCRRKGAGRSLSDLLDTIQYLEACGVDLYLDQQAIDMTNPPWGKLVFHLSPHEAGGNTARQRSSRMAARARNSCTVSPQL